MAQSEEDITKLPEPISHLELNVEDLDDIDGAANNDGYVYCIAESEHGRLTGYFKVGTTTQPNKRLSDLQTGNVRQLKYWVQPKYLSRRLDVERAAHTALSRYAVDLGGGKEWFQASTNCEQVDFYNRFCTATGIRR